MKTPATGATPAELSVSDSVGRLMEFWGFKRNMGRVWSLLYLSPSPLTAKDLRARLGLSAGAVSMTLAELARWGVVRKVWVQGERQDYFAAEVNLWKMVSRVLNERERAEIVAAVETFETAARIVAQDRRSGDPAVRRRAALQSERIGQLLDLAKLGRSLLDALLASAKLDIGPLTRFVFRTGR
jgi:DNA-binding transcriptional regulator GbsR (MarR family)